jgi:hypothetical protein
MYALLDSAGGVPQWRQPSKPRPSGPTRLGALARDRYRGIESPRTPSHSVTSHSVTQRTLPPHIPPRKDSQPQNAGTKYAEFATPQVPQAPQDDSRNIVWKQITTPQMPDRSMLRGKSMCFRRYTLGHSNINYSQKLTYQPKLRLPTLLFTMRHTIPNSQVAF